MQQSELCVFQCVASAAHFFIYERKNVMTGAIKDLWHGNLCPQDKPLPHQLMELFNLTSSYRQKLFDQLPEEQQHLFDSFLDA